MARAQNEVWQYPSGVDGSGDERDKVDTYIAIPVIDDGEMEQLSSHCQLVIK